MKEFTVEIIKEEPHTWYSNKLGWQYDVIEANFAGIPCYVTVETMNRFWPLFISKENCRIVG